MSSKSDEVYIYIPGFGDLLTRGRKLLIRLFWRGRRVVVFDSRWSDIAESATDKKRRLKRLIDRHDGKQLVFVGESAGGSLAILMAMEYSDRARFVTICGYNHDQASIHQIHQQTHLAFFDLVGEIDKKLAKLPKKVAVQSLVLYSL
ncbi:MAG: alpha/beta fold hydrolase, partial [Candidatus Saccharimonadales bacterium]